MRWILATVLFLSTLPVQAQENEAEKLFRAMEKKICSAKSLKVVSVSVAEGDFMTISSMIPFPIQVSMMDTESDITVTFNTTAQFAEGNKSRIAVEARSSK